MKRRQLLASLCGAATWPAVPALAAPPAPGERVSWPAVELLDGGPWSPPEGAAVVVFFSTTCPFCMRHNAHIEKLRRQLGGAAPMILGVARDRDPEAVRRYVGRHGLGFPVTLNHAAMSAALSTRRMIPLTVTVDRQRRLRQVIPGEMFEDDVLELANLAAG